ncbi:hypothetical protein AURDEDRAFT_161617 [Auricularia subglabra TFB-10046 SS5]|nr:hypothetical protein AURDEDRAFT_161617 [Auricularia subglabra TFB-10046 SS5]
MCNLSNRRSIADLDHDLTDQRTASFARDVLPAPRCRFSRCDALFNQYTSDISRIEATSSSRRPLSTALQRGVQVLYESHCLCEFDILSHPPALVMSSSSYVLSASLDFHLDPEVAPQYGDPMLAPFPSTSVRLDALSAQ